MSKAIVVVLVLLIFFPLAAGEGYIVSRVAPLLEEGRYGAPRAGILRQGALVEILEEQGEWLNVAVDGKEGFVQAIFVGTEPSVAAPAAEQGEAPAISVRKRASSYTSSAAAARGLSSENVRDRANVAFKSYDFDSIDWLEETFNYSADELVEFAQEQLLFL